MKIRGYSKYSKMTHIRHVLALAWHEKWEAQLKKKKALCR